MNQMGLVQIISKKILQTNILVTNIRFQLKKQTKGNNFKLLGTQTKTDYPLSKSADPLFGSMLINRPRSNQ